MIKFGKNTWLNISLKDVLMVEVNAKPFETLSEDKYYYISTEFYYVEVTFHNGVKALSEAFNTNEEAYAYAKSFVRALQKKEGELWSE